MLELLQGNVIYESTWYVTGGRIIISIDKYDNLSGKVVITYLDAQNVETKIQQDIDDI